jgi:signal transduction histidine kinase
MDPIKVLLVDDRRENLFALEALLATEGVQFHKALSGVQALDLLLDHEFALALVDVQMPEMDGFELAELMRGTERSRAVPIIFVTAGAHSRQSTFRGYEKGAVDFLYKPLDPHVVKSKVQVFIELARQRQLTLAQLEETRRALVERDQALETAGRALRTRDEFMTIASHELKTPITSLKLQLQMSRRGIDPARNVVPSAERLAKMIDVSSRQIDRLSELIEDLLDVSRIQSGKVEYNPQPFTLRSLVDEVLERFGESLQASGGRLEIEVPEEIQVEWDRSKVEQVLVNLVTNAIKYAPGSPVVLRSSDAGGRITIVVEDSGPGIPPERRTKIFERFERATNARNVTGLGIGLYIVSRILQDHQGTIRVEDTGTRDGKPYGSRFVIELPTRPFSMPGALTTIAIEAPKTPSLPASP